MENLEKIYCVFETFTNGKRKNMQVFDENVIQEFLTDLEYYSNDDNYIVDYHINYKSLKDTYFIAKWKGKDAYHKIRLISQSAIKDLF